MGSSFSKASSQADLSVLEGESVLSATTTATIAFEAPRARTRASTARKVKTDPESKAVKAHTNHALQAESYMEAEDDDFTVKVPEKIAGLPEGRKRTSDEIERDLAAALQGRKRGGDLSARGPPPKRMGLRTASGLFQLQPVPIMRRTESPPQDTEMTDVDSVQPPAAVTTKEAQNPVHEGLLGVTEEVEMDEATKEVVKETKPNAKAGKRKANPKTKVEAQPELAPALEPETNATEEIATAEPVLDLATASLATPQPALEPETTTTEKIATAEPVHELATASPATPQLPLEPEMNTTEKIATAEPVHELATASPVTPQPKKANKAPKKAKEAVTKPKNKRVVTAATTTEPSSPPQPSKKPTASPSPQSSNAENHPPTEEPFDIMSIFSPPMSPHKRALLAAEYAQLSPPRNNTNTGARRPQPAHTWTPADLETIFLPPPSAGKANKQNMVLTTSEKEMSVEEWVAFNAEEAYEKLRQDGERYAQAFEAEGLKALKALEALECV